MLMGRTIPDGKPEKPSNIKENRFLRGYQYGLKAARRAPQFSKR